MGHLYHSEALAYRNFMNFGSVSEFVNKLSNPQQSVDIGGGWSIRYNSSANGFEFFNPSKCPSGLPCCPVNNCGGYIYGGVFCQHVSLPPAISKDTLFPDGHFSVSEYIRLKNVMCAAWGLLWDEEGPNEELSVLDRLSNGAFLSTRHSVHVDYVKPNGLSLIIRLLHGGAFFYTCKEPDCNYMGTEAFGSDYACSLHVGTMTRWRKSQSIARKKVAFQALHERFNRTKCYERGDPQLWTNTLQHIANAGSVGHQVDMDDGYITIRFTDRNLSWKAWYSDKFWHVCLSPFCLRPLKDDALLQLGFCSDHVHAPDIDINQINFP